MKTRIFLTTLMFIFASYMVIEASDTKAKDTLFASVLKNATDQELTAGIRMINDFYLKPANTFENEVNEKEMAVVESGIENSMLEEWVTTRDNWEQKGNDEAIVESAVESSMLGEWIASRDKWEQKGNDKDAVGSAVENSMLEEWVTSRDNWEQNDNENVATGFDNSLLEQWINSRDSWEQK